MLFFSFFKSLVGQDVVVELKNDLSICGTLHSVDQYLNMKLTDISVAEPEKFPQMHAVKNCFIRGSVVRYVQLPADRHRPGNDETKIFFLLPSISLTDNSILQC
ncbi:unnamed protein product [Cylicocyclus nassatus]|uniref:Sm domain-containing protein n=1 Tax=Cylicocyclus nassatus TaxID=53992 RepID=A0AA36M6V7_CYLNA|nr:unnamed protein product [Cylicocyclus nassatus]